MNPYAIDVRAAMEEPKFISHSVPGVKMLLRSGPGAEIPMHEHSRPFVTVLLQGISDETDERGRTQRTGSGTLNYTPAGSRHAHHFISDPCTTLCAEFMPALMALAEDRKSSLARPQLIRSGAAVDAAQRISLELLCQDEVSTLVLQGLFIELLGEISRAPSDAYHGAPSWLTLACEMLREEPIGKLSIQDVAEEVAVHPSHLAKCFRRFVGQSPGEFARNVRLERALSELQRSSKPIKMISNEAGFADQAHFTRAFKRAFGYAPSAVRRVP